MSISTSKLLDSSPFVVLSNSDGSSSGPGSSSEEVLDLLGQCGAGNLYLNRKPTPLGLVCGGLAKDVENAVKSLMASHLRDENAQVLVIYAHGSTIKPAPCPLVALGQEECMVLVSPRDFESSSALYTSIGATTVPLRFEEGSVATRHILSLFTPPLEMDGRDATINTVRFILSQMAEPFNLQHFIELVDKENWTGAGDNFIALRQTILISLLSSQSSTSFPSARQIVVDLRDHILRSTGIEAVLMDMALHQLLLQPSTRRRLIVFYNTFDHVPSDSPLSQSLESLSASGGRPSVIVATTSPSSIPNNVFNSLEYLICGLRLSSVWHGVLRDHFSIDLSRLGRQSGQQVIWSPQSRIYPDFEHETDHQPQYWDDNLVIMPIPSEYQDIFPKILTNLDSPATQLNSGVSMQPTNQAPLSSSFKPEEEEGMVPLRPTATGVDMFDDTIHRSGETTFAGSENNQSQITGQRVTVSIAEQKQQPTIHCGTYPDLFCPLIAGVLSLRNSEGDGWVGFGDLRMIVGDSAAIKALGWNTYTSFVKKAVEQRVLELRMVGKRMESVRLLPLKIWEDHIRLLTPSSLILGICPTGHGGPRPIVEAILQLTGGDINAKVTLEDLNGVFAETPEELETLKISGLSFGHLVKLACEGGWTQKGKFEGHRCVWLGPKLHPLAETLKAVQNLGPY